MPASILEALRVIDLAREQVSSYLQKFRKWLRAGGTKVADRQPLPDDVQYRFVEYGISKPYPGHSGVSASPQSTQFALPDLPGYATRQGDWRQGPGSPHSKRMQHTDCAAMDNLPSLQGNQAGGCDLGALVNGRKGGITPPVTHEPASPDAIHGSLGPTDVSYTDWLHKQGQLTDLTGL